MDPKNLLETFGTIGLFAIIFAESGLLIGFFLPGDSLLFTAGVFCAKGDLSLAIVLPGVFLAAVVGDQVGYAFGHRVGPALFRRPDSRFFKHTYIEKAHGYFERYGPKTIVLARFIPIVRTFAPIVAGAGAMPYRTFALFNLVGGVLWGVGVTMLGFLLGEAIDIDRYLYPVIGVIVVLSVVPVYLEYRKVRRHAANDRPVEAEPLDTLDQPR